MNAHTREQPSVVKVLYDPHPTENPEHTVRVGGFRPPQTPPPGIELVSLHALWIMTRAERVSTGGPGYSVRGWRLELSRDMMAYLRERDEQAHGGPNDSCMTVH